MNKDRAKLGQKIIWHVRWILLVAIMGLNVFAYIQDTDLNFILIVDGFCFALYLLLAQVEGYFECHSTCRMK